MFCPKCGAQNSDEIKVCSSCGFDFSEVSNEKESSNSISTQITASDSGKKLVPLKAIIFSTLAAVVLIMLFIASTKVSNGGTEIMQIQSVGGKTLDEAYYFELGQIYAGYALIIRALGIFFASVLVWIGLKKD